MTAGRGGAAERREVADPKRMYIYIINGTLRVQLSQYLKKNSAAAKANEELDNICVAAGICGQSMGMPHRLRTRKRQHAQ